MNSAPVPAKPSASVVLARDASDGVEILLLRRNDKVAFHGGAWVFPGGRVDDSDRQDDADSDDDVAMRAAAREAHEETGLTVSPRDMLQFAHWTTPVELPKRFSTWFFVAPYTGGETVRVDDSEIVDAQWVKPVDALAQRDQGEIELPGPTYISLLDFKRFETVDDLIAATRADGIRTYVPRIAKGEGFRCAIYAEDAAYESLDLDTAGPRHRLVMSRTEWQYLREY